jgi:putative hemolysin
MPDPASSNSGNPIVDVAIVLALILVGGFFAASEIALITVKRHRLSQLIGEGSGAARVAQHLTEDPSRFLATIQIALTFLGFLASAFGALSLSGSLANLVKLVPIAFIQDAASGISFVLVTLLIALASIIVGELVPKTLALTFADRFALFVARPIGWFDRALRPIVWFVSTVSNVLVRALGGKDRPRAGYLSTEELKMLVETGSEQGSIEEGEKEMIHGVIELADTKVHQVMVPRIGIQAIEVNEPVEDVLEMIVQAGHSRVPVYEENLDNIVGILYAKDLLPYLMPSATPSSQIDVRALARPATYVPETKPVDELLHEMRASKRHIAIVVDEYGGTAGLITMEDVVEEIVGEIQDEYDSEESLVEALEDNEQIAFRLDGRVSMDDVRDLFELSDTEESDEDEYDTVGGFIVHRVGRIPLPGAVVPFRDVTLRVESAEPRRVAKVIATRPRQLEAEEAERVLEGAD